jgi:leucyl aminopeptidase
VGSSPTLGTLENKNDMKIIVSTKPITEQITDLCVLFPQDIKKADTLLGGMLSEVIKQESFSDKKGKTLVFHTHGKIKSRSLLVLGIGDKPLDVSDWQTIGATIARQAKASKCTSISMTLSQNLVQPVVEGLYLGSYEFLQYKKKDDEKHTPIENVIICIGEKDVKATTVALELAHLTSQATLFARDLVNEPSSMTTPTHLAGVAATLAKKYGYGIEILGTSEMKNLKMNALLAIAKGSDEEPKFIKLAYIAPKATKTICLVGKGITFDSGGLSLKPGNSMETMKCDMAGAAAILGVFSVLSNIKPNVTVVGLIAATENMPSGKAIKPGDVVTAMNGKTIEIANTDAEGRVILADAVSYAEEFVKPDAMIDLATLTGACMVALGEDIAGLFSNNKELSDALKNAAETSGEKIWELPLVASYNDLMKSHIADIRNISKSRYGGAITGALFIGAFVKDTLPWAHLDIAGPAFAEKDELLTPYGGTGFGVRTLLSYLQSEGK